MSISYSPLFSMLHERKLKFIDLQKSLGLSPRTTAKFSKDEYVSLEVIDKICTMLDCEIQDIIKIKKI